MRVFQKEREREGKRERERERNVEELSVIARPKSKDEIVFLYGVERDHGRFTGDSVHREIQKFR